jgi:MoaA/NifB/PqqE/SkfB family radical SAM enzyme
MLDLRRTKEYLIFHTMRGVLRVIPHISNERLVSFARREIEKVKYPEGREFLEKMLILAKQFLPKASRACQDKIVENFIINANLRGVKLRSNFQMRTGVEPPTLIVISPMMRCNLRCAGCYAGEYSRSDDMPKELFDRILQEAKEMGIFFVTILGGEPFLSQDVIDMLEKHNDIYFQVYTNGTLIDQEMAHYLSNIGNVFPSISVEGFEKETDERRGKGTFQKILRAMKFLREAGVLFGFSATVTRQNNELIVSDEFIRFYMEQGCFLGWYFQYIPVGRGPSMDLVPTPEQRIYRLRKIREARRRYPILLADFWNDGPLSGGCLAGGSSYLHITARGDVEPCVFAHFAVDNIHNKTLTEVLQSDFFNAIKERQPFSENLLRPCMIIDAPEILRELVFKYGARPTHPGAESILTDLAEQIDRNARRYKELADAEWETFYAPCYSKCLEKVKVGARA